MDVDNPMTWPGTLADRVFQLAEQVRGTADLCVELDVWQHACELCRLLDGWLVRAFHCTRLLDHEVDAIRAQGLRALAADLISSRLTGALNHGHISEAEHAELDETHHFAKPFSRQAQDLLAGKVCLALPRRAFDDRPDGFRPLLTRWGGEAIYARHYNGRAPLVDRLKAIGRPTIVVARVELSDPSRHYMSPSLAHLLVGTVLQLPDAHSSLHYKANIPAEHIEQLLQPGDPDYDRHVDLPTS
ncbi:hypothetical protein [Alloactinosynnema sp. L-07]|nr:hypothetical protein [Alloactinosynnema sp. L-07]